MSEIMLGTLLVCMGSDLFGSYAESSCDAFVVGLYFTAMCYPLLISSMGIIVCLITTLFATDFCYGIN